jgi:peptidylprolyl isomerase
MRRAAALIAALALAVTGCGGDDDSSGEQEAAAPTETATATATVDPALKDTSKKPEVTVPPGDPPTALQSTDIVVGDGAEAKAGDTVAVQYVGVSQSTGEEFDASWDRGEPFEFQLGTGAVISGWDQGVEGMRVGGRRQLVIPPDLAYGEQGQPPTIAPNETLVFVIDLLRIR